LPGAEHPESCPECGSPLSGGQRYCLQCGARVSARGPLIAGLLARAGAQARVPAAGAQPAAPQPDAPQPEAEPPAVPRRRFGLAPLNLRLPSPTVSVLLVALFLGFGVVLGNVAAKPQGGALDADAGSHLRLLLPSTPTGSTGTSATGSAVGSAGGGSPSAESTGSSAAEEAESEAETGSTEAATTSTAAKKPASTRSGSSSNSAGSGAAGAGSESGAGSGAAGVPAAKSKAKPKLPPIKHVFVIALSDEPYAAAFGPISTAPYLSHTLEQKGELLVRYDAVAHEELADEVALLSGQGPTAETAANCPTYSEITPTGIGADEQVLGSGCVYPSSTPTLPGQLTSRHLTWKAYVQGTDEPGAEAGACDHPAPGASDPTSVQSAGTGAYATFRNPFVYFGSIVGSPACASEDVGLAALKGDLASAKLTPSFSYIAPDRCHDGNPTPCAAGAPAGMAPADTFLASVVPQILASKAYAEGGLLVITVDEAPSSGEYADSSSCCGQPRFPNLAGEPSGLAGLSPRGGGAVGALLLSPYVKGGTTSEEPFNHFSLLRTIEDLFKLPHLGYARLAAVKSFEPSMFTATPASSR